MYKTLLDVYKFSAPENIYFFITEWILSWENAVIVGSLSNDLSISFN